MSDGMIGEKTKNIAMYAKKAGFKAKRSGFFGAARIIKVGEEQCKGW
jgi:hypothetical protein